MDLLAEPDGRLVLRRYDDWYEKRGEDVAAREIRALELAQRAGVPAPAPIWLDTGDVVEEPATLISCIDAAFCSMDISYLGMDRVADRFISAYREISGDPLATFEHCESVALCRPMPDIAIWVPAWSAFGRNISEDRARSRYTEVPRGFPPTHELRMIIVRTSMVRSL